MCVKKLRYGVVFIFFFFTLFICRGIFAQESVGIGLSPPTFELSANPGEVIENTIRVQNLTNEMMTIEAGARNFIAIGEEGAVGLTEGKTSFSLASWISINPVKMEISPQGTKTVAFKIAIPLYAEPGGHFGSIVFRTGLHRAENQTGAVVAQELGSLLLLRVAGHTKEKASLQSFTAQKKLWEKGPALFEAKIKNEGNVHLKPNGTITVTDFLGTQVAAIPIEPKNVLPEAVRKISSAWKKKFILGHYTATISLVYGNEGKVLTASTNFYGFPYKLIGGIFIGLMILFTLLYRIRKRIALAFKVLFGKYEK